MPRASSLNWYYHRSELKKRLGWRYRLGLAEQTATLRTITQMWLFRFNHPSTTIVFFHQWIGSCFHVGIMKTVLGQVRVGVAEMKFFNLLHHSSLTAQGSSLYPTTLNQSWLERTLSNYFVPCYVCSKFLLYFPAFEGGSQKNIYHLPTAIIISIPTFSTTLTLKKKENALHRNSQVETHSLASLDSRA